MSDFVHLHLHSQFSLLDGANRIVDLADHVQRLGMDSLAVTDHGNMHAAWSFYETAKARKLRPILGFEAYLAYEIAPTLTGMDEKTLQFIMATYEQRRKEARSLDAMSKPTVTYPPGSWASARGGGGSRNPVGNGGWTV